MLFQFLVKFVFMYKVISKGRGVLENSVKKP